MKIFDLSQPIYNGMPVYPGDPEVEIKQVLHFEKDGWNMETLFLPTHIATHVNVPVHGMQKGKDLDDLPLDVFFGKSVVVSDVSQIKRGYGLFFCKKEFLCNLHARKILEMEPKMVGICGYFESEQELSFEKRLLSMGVITYEGLVNLDKIPKEKAFQFYGFPLKIRKGFGSPVRAVAVVE
jgi:kynurenine formamidase